MVGPVGWNRVLHALLVPGIVLHELAHALTVVLIPGVRITELDLTSHVSHEGRYTVTRSFLISYAPLWINTGVALLAAYYAAGLNPTNSVEAFLSVCALSYLSIITAFTAFPSFQDAINPLRMLWAQLATRRAVILVPVTPIVVVLATPGVVLTYAFRRLALVRLLCGILYAVGVVLTGFGVLDPVGYLTETILEGA